MDQLLLLGRDLARAEQRFRYTKEDRRRVLLSQKLDSRFKKAIKLYECLLKKAEKEIITLRVGNTLSEVKKEVVETLNETSETRGAIIKRSMIRLEFYPITLVVYFKNGQDAKTYLDECSYGYSCLMQNNLTKLGFPIAMIVLGKRTNWMYHEYTHVFNIYREHIFGKIEEPIDELSAYLLSCPLVRMRMLDQTRAVELAEKYDLGLLKKELECDLAGSVCYETGKEVPLLSRVNARTMLGPIMDMDAREIENILSMRLPHKTMNKALCGQHPFSHLAGQTEVLFLASSVISLTNGENRYSYRELLDCIACK